MVAPWGLNHGIQLVSDEMSAYELSTSAMNIEQHVGRKGFEYIELGYGHRRTVGLLHFEWWKTDPMMRCSPTENGSRRRLGLPPRFPIGQPGGAWRCPIGQ